MVTGGAVDWELVLRLRLDSAVEVGEKEGLRTTLQELFMYCPGMQSVEKCEYSSLNDIEEEISNFN